MKCFDTMIACLDVHYEREIAHAAAIVFDKWEAVSSLSEYTAFSTNATIYAPGRFYLRELRPLLNVAQSISEAIDVYVIDAYCHLSADLAPGLGAYFYEALKNDASVIGVAKNRFRNTQHAVELIRGKSRRPLFITSIGMQYETAASNVRMMAGNFRIPTMIKAADRLAREQIYLH